MSTRWLQSHSDSCWQHTIVYTSITRHCGLADQLKLNGCWKCGGEELKYRLKGIYLSGHASPPVAQEMFLPAHGTPVNEAATEVEEPVHSFSIAWLIMHEYSYRERLLHGSDALIGIIQFIGKAPFND